MYWLNCDKVTYWSVRLHSLTAQFIKCSMAISLSRSIPSIFFFFNKYSHTCFFDCRHVIGRHWMNFVRWLLVSLQCVIYLVHSVLFLTWQVQTFSQRTDKKNKWSLKDLSAWKDLSWKLMKSPEIILLSEVLGQRWSWPSPTSLQIKSFNTISISAGWVHYPR